VPDLKTKSLAAAALSALTLGAMLLFAQGSAAAARTPAVRVSLERRSIDAAATGTVEVVAVTRTRNPGTRATVRLRLLDPQGQVLFQDTKVTSGSDDSAVSRTRFRTRLDSRIEEGRYVLEVSSRTAAGSAETTGPLLVVGAGRKPLPVTVVLRTSYVPQRDPDGRFVSDPGLEDAARRQTDEAATLASLRPDLRLSLALPPVMLDEWADVANGYDYASAGGVTPVPADSAVPRQYARTLSAVSDAATRGVALLKLGYADPDLAGLARIGGLADVASQLEMGADVYRSVLGARPASATLFLSPSVPATVPALLRESGITQLLIAPTSASAGGKPAPGGVYRAQETTVSALVLDPGLSRLLRNGSTTRDELTSAMFDRLTLRDAPRAAIAVIDVGPGSSSTVADLQAHLAALARVPWVRLVDVPGLATATRSGAVRLPATAKTDTATPAGYWADVSSARIGADALTGAAGETDPDAVRARRLVAVSESREWAGPDGQWALGERGRSYASAAQRVADTTFAQIGLSVPNVTLSGSSGKVPVSITNQSDKELAVMLTAYSTDLKRPRSQTTPLDLKPGENIFSVPVELGSNLSGRLNVRLWMRERVILESSSVVRASYMDRIVLIGMVVLVLLGLLLFIRSRTAAAQDAALEPADQDADDSRTENTPADHTHEDRPR
jgi:hypothetical protein